MATRLPNASQQAAADAVVDRADAGAAAGRLRIYTGAAPADADTAASGTLLVDIPLADPAFGSADATGTATLASPPRSAAAAASGIAGYFRITDSTGACVVQGDVTATGGGGDLELDNTNIATGQTVNVNSLTYQQLAS